MPLMKFYIFSFIFAHVAVNFDEKPKNVREKIQPFPQGS